MCFEKIFAALFFAYCTANIEGRLLVVAPLSLCVLRYFFHLRDFRFHRFYQLCELFLVFSRFLPKRHLPKQMPFGVIFDRFLSFRKNISLP